MVCKSELALTHPRKVWKLIVEGQKAGSLNMATDEALFREVSSQGAIRATYLRFYQWERPTLSLGFSQKAARVVNFDFCGEHGIDVVRRITGGKAVLHDKELTYAVISNDPEVFPLNDVIGTYNRIAQALSLGLKELGLDVRLAQKNGGSSQIQAGSTACFAVSNHYEILCRGRKLVGSAQRRTRNSFLQHGSILLDFDPWLLNGALRNTTLLELQLRVTSLRECLGHSPDLAHVVNYLVKGFREFFGIGFEQQEKET